jgi:hypothetical protein
MGNQWFDPTFADMDKHPNLQRPEAFSQFTDLMVAHAFFERDPIKKRAWGWKSTLNYLYLRTLSRAYPEMKYVHIIRSPYDLAFGTKFEQMRRYASVVGSSKGFLEWWIRANRRALQAAREVLPIRWHIVFFEDLCEDPFGEVRRLAEFMAIGSEGAQIAKATSLVKDPGTIGRAANRVLTVTGEQARSIYAYGYSRSFKGRDKNHARIPE